METAAPDTLGRLTLHAFVAALGVVLTWMFFEQGAAIDDVPAYRRALAARPSSAVEVEAPAPDPSQARR